MERFKKAFTDIPSTVLRQERRWKMKFLIRWRYNNLTYLMIGYIELIAVVLLTISTLYMTKIGISHGLLEGNPSVSYLFLSVGYYVEGVMGIILIFIAFIVMYFVSRWLSSYWLLVLVFTILLFLKAMDAYHDFMMLKSIGVY